MKKNIETQYNKFHNVYSENIFQDEKSNAAFYQQIDFALEGKNLLDVGCGDGNDLKYFAKHKAIIHGIDPSSEFIAKAKEANPSGVFAEAKGEQIPFTDNTFDIVVSKWTLQTSPDVPQIMKEIARVLRPGGILLFLSKHPWMQWMEKVRDYGHGADYYEQKVVTSNIFSGKIVLKEPSHTIGDYFNKEFYSNFEVLDYQEGTDFPASEQISGGVYPTFFVVKAKKKHRRISNGGTRLENCNFSVHLFNLLKPLNIEFMEDLKDFSEKELRKMPRFGDKAMYELKEELLKKNISLRKD